MKLGEMKLVIPTTNLQKQDGVKVEHQFHRHWMVEAFVNRHGGRMVITDLHIIATTATVPPGGITQKLIRLIPYATIPAFAEAAIQRIDAKNGLAKFFRDAAAMKLRPKLSTERPRPRRAMGKDDRYYAELAAAYLSLIEHGSRRPVHDLAIARRLPTARARDQVHEARARGLLSKGIHGVRGGHLLPRALSLLSITESLK